MAAIAACRTCGTEPSENARFCSQLWFTSPRRRYPRGVQAGHGSVRRRGAFDGHRFFFFGLGFERDHDRPDRPRFGGSAALWRHGIMADSEQASPANLLDQLADLDPQEKREVATILRQLSADLR